MHGVCKTTAFLVRAGFTLGQASTQLCGRHHCLLHYSYTCWDKILNRDNLRNVYFGSQFEGVHHKGAVAGL